MKRYFYLSIALLLCFYCAFSSVEYSFVKDEEIDSLRLVYAGDSKFWPKANVDKGVVFEELGAILKSPVDLSNDSVKAVVHLGKTLFFDARLSGSNKISCASCHNPDKYWADGLRVSIGNDGLENLRNSPSLENVWIYKRFFWDGRAYSLQEQAEGPIAAHNEMAQNLKTLAKELSAVKGYAPLFKAAFGTSKISNKLIFEGLATFQRTIVSGPSKFDNFLNGDIKALTNQEVLGLHVFRTKARCMNCHGGIYFTNKDFHNLGLTEYKKKHEDLGLYNHTKQPADVGKFKTPGLRNVMNTGPWFHNGSVTDMDSLMILYNMGMVEHEILPGQENDPLLPKNDKLVRGIMLSFKERKALIAFLGALSSPVLFEKPVAVN